MIPNLELVIIFSPSVRIIDDDADLKTLKSTAAGVDVSDDEAPTVAEFIDERPQHIRRLEEYRNTGRWKVLGENNSRNGKNIF